MTGNRLARETSPYLLQHADNPVDWHPWGAEALAEARRTGRPILLSVGYAACHWCHVMAHESFEDPATAAVMNRLFINIKVDREERPDIDQIYMAALHALGEQGGWPLTMFLTPAGEPIWGGTYFPPEPRYGRPSFADALEEVARIFREAPERIEQNRAGLLERLRDDRVAAAVEPGEPLLDAAAERLHALIDPRWGGIAGAPKFPQASLLEFLWRSARRTGRGAYADAVAITLRQMAQGGIYDHLAGGFARYSVDERWLVPHFEKMLYDNAQLVERLTFAWLASGDPLFRWRVEETVAWLEREMSVGPAFASSLDADSADGEGAFAVWTPAELDAVLGADDAAFFASVYDVTDAGNFEGRSIPNRLKAMTPRADADEERLRVARARLLAARAGRPQPARDDKVLADWNGLAIAALAVAGFAMERPDWTARAEAAFAFLRDTMIAGGRLRHSWRDGRIAGVGFASDYAGTIKAALALHDATGAGSYLAEAVALASAADRHHWDEAASAYRLAATDADDLVARPLGLVDEATPSPNGLMAANLVRLWRLTGEDRFRARADALLQRHAGSVAQNVVGGASLLNAIDLRLDGADIVLLVPQGTSADDLLAAIRAGWSDNFTLAVVPGDAASLPAGHPAHGKRALSGLPTAYVCRGQSCSAPVSDPVALRELLAES